MGKPHWSLDARTTALALINGKKHSLREISEITNIPQQTLSNLKRRNTPISKPHPPRGKKLDDRDKRRINLYVRSNSASRRTSATNIGNELSLDVSGKTLRKALSELG